MKIKSKKCLWKCTQLSYAFLIWVCMHMYECVTSRYADRTSILIDYAQRIFCVNVGLVDRTHRRQVGEDEYECCCLGMMWWLWWGVKEIIGSLVWVSGGRNLWQVCVGKWWWLWWKETIRRLVEIWGGRRKEPLKDWCRYDVMAVLGEEPSENWYRYDVVISGKEPLEAWCRYNVAVLVVWGWGRNHQKFGVDMM